MSTKKMSLYYVVLYLLPKNCVSRLLGFLVSMPLPAFFAAMVNRIFARTFKINLDEAEHPLASYKNLQGFFIRRLKPGVRPIANDPDLLISPCDGHLSVHGTIDGDKLVQIKGKYYDVQGLLLDQDLGAQFYNGHCATLYLSPKDYHRFHAPVDGEIIRSYYIPGALWPVNSWAVTHIDELFCHNERVITIIKEQKTGKLLAYIAVGACVVGKIALSYTDFDQYEKRAHKKKTVAIDHHPLSVTKGQELGRFMFGSTIVLLMEPGLLASFVKEGPSHVKMGEILGKLQVRARIE